MPSTPEHPRQSGSVRLSRRRFVLLTAATGAAGLAAACSSAAPTAPTAAPATAPSVVAAAPPPSAAPAVIASPSAAPAVAPSAAASPSAAPAASGVPAGGPVVTGFTPAGQITFAKESSQFTFYDPGYNAAAGNELWLVYDGLVWIAGDGSVQPGLATSWKSLDNNTWEFTLGNYKWHNNRAVSSQDVADTFKRYSDPANKLLAGTLMTNVANVATPDAKTVRIMTKNPDPALPSVLANALILPMQEVNSGGQSFWDAPIGSGAYKMLSWNSKQTASFTAIGKDWGNPRGAPKTKDVKYIYQDDLASQAAGLRAGDSDVVFFFTSDPIPALVQAGLKVYAAKSTATFSQVIDTFNGPTRDVRVRQAINYAVDKQAIIDAFYAKGLAPDGQLIQSNALGFNANVKPYPYDAAKAKELLAAAGFASGLTLNQVAANVPTMRPDLSTAIQGYLAAVGIVTNITTLDFPAWLAAYAGPPEQRPGLFSEYISYAGTYEPNLAWNWFSSDVPLEKGRKWVDDQFDQMYQKAKTTFDRTQRGQLYQLAAQYLHDQAPVLFVAPGLFNVVYNQKVDLGVSAWTYTADYYTHMSKSA